MAERSWVQRQEWRDLLFAHWPIRISTLRPLVPRSLELDCFDGQAWVGIVPFRMTGVRLRWLPSLPWLSAFPELNLRTYVRHRGQSGIYFFSLDAPNPLAVTVARRLYHLPYHRAEITMRSDQDGISYDCRRRQRDAPPAAIGVDYRPIGDAFRAEAGSLEHFLVERYALFCASANGKIHACRLQHPAWKLMPAEAEFRYNTMTESVGFSLPETKPLLWYSGLQATLLSAPQTERECHMFAQEAAPELRATRTIPALIDR